MNYLLFTKENFFGLSSFEFKDIFDDTTVAWEVLPKIGRYIESLFEKKVFVSNYKDKKNIYIGEDSIIQEGATIVGPAIIGKNCIIGHASLIRENCIFGNNVHIGHAVEVKNSIFLNGATAAHLNYIGDSLIGNNVNVSGGAILANYRFDKKSVAIRNGKERINTNLQKFGAIVGDESIIGVNAVLNPGTILGKGCIAYPLTFVTGVHKDGEIIR